MARRFQRKRTYAKRPARRTTYRAGGRSARRAPARAQTLRIVVEQQPAGFAGSPAVPMGAPPRKRVF